MKNTTLSEQFQNKRRKKVKVDSPNMTAQADQNLLPPETRGQHGRIKFTDKKTLKTPKGGNHNPYLEEHTTQ